MSRADSSKIRLASAAAKLAAELDRPVADVATALVAIDRHARRASRAKERYHIAHHAPESTSENLQYRLYLARREGCDVEHIAQSLGLDWQWSDQGPTFTIRKTGQPFDWH